MIIRPKIIEGVADTILFTFVTLPCLIIVIFAQPTPYDLIGGIVLMFMFGGSLLFLLFPILIPAVAASLAMKVRRFTHGYRPKTISDVAKELLYAFPFLVIASVLMLLLVSLFE